MWVKVRRSIVVLSHAERLGNEPQAPKATVSGIGLLGSPPESP